MNLDLYHDDLFPSEALVSAPTLINKATQRFLRLGRAHSDIIVREEPRDLDLMSFIREYLR